MLRDRPRVNIGEPGGAVDSSVLCWTVDTSGLCLHGSSRDEDRAEGDRAKFLLRVMGKQTAAIMNDMHYGAADGCHIPFF